MYYYIPTTSKNDKRGPFSLNDLLEQDLTEKDLVWKNGNPTWKEAIEFEELKDYFNKKKSETPPLTPNELKKNKLNKSLIEIGRRTALLFIPVLCILLLIGGYFTSNTYYLRERYAGVFGDESQIKQAILNFCLILSLFVSPLIAWSFNLFAFKSILKKLKYFILIMISITLFLYLMYLIMNLIT